MEWVSTLSIFLSIVYAVLLFMYRQAWRALPAWELPDGFVPKTRITVLIPARNEADNIAGCLQAVLDGNYPHSILEIIVLDDFSTDETVEIVQLFSQKFKPPGSLISCICLADHLPPEAIFSPNKKKAIEIGVAHAKGEIIVTTDADCIVPKDWLLSHLLAFENASVILPQRDTKAANRTRSWVLARRASVRKESSSLTKSSNIVREASCHAI